MTSLLNEPDATEVADMNKPEEGAPPADIDLNAVPAKPEGVPDEFWDAEKGTYKAEDLYKGYKTEQEKALGLRKKLSVGAQNAPKDVSGYKLEWDDPEVEIDDDNDQVKVFKEISFENGLNQEQFNGLMKSFQKAYKDGKLQQNEQVSQEQEQEYAQNELKRLGSDSKQIVDSYKGWGRSLVQSKVLSQEEYNDFVKMPATAEHMRILTKIRQASGYVNDIPAGGIPIDGGKTREEIDALIASEDYDRNPASKKIVEDYFNKTYPS